MYSSFSFRLMDEGAPTQRISFTPAGADPVDVPVPGSQFPQEFEPRFRQMYQVLIEQGLVPNTTPILQGLLPA